MDKANLKQPMKILLVENSRTARLLLTHQLQEAGYEVEAVGSGLEAIDAVEQANFNLVIMDVFLPQMNGYEATQKIRSNKSNKADLVILAFTSSTNEKDKKLCIESGMNDYVLKSEDNHELMSVLSEYQKKFEDKQRKPDQRAS